MLGLLARTGPTRRTPDVKIFGFLLLLAGWGLVLAALVLLAASVPRAAFVLAGLGVEIAGLALVLRAHWASQGARE
jgi:uncharacterized membrane protein